MIVASLLLLSMLSSCVWGSGRFTRKANYDKEAARAAIQEIKEQPLVIVLPTEAVKIALLARTGKVDAAEKIKEDLEIINGLLIEAFSTNFTFTDVVFMPDSLVNDYEKGRIDKAFLDENGNLTLGPDNISRTPYKIVVYDFRAFEIIRQNKLISNPFPNRFGTKMEVPGKRSGLVGVTQSLFLKPFEFDAVAEARRIDDRFKGFYELPDLQYWDVREDLKPAR